MTTIRLISHDRSRRVVIYVTKPQVEKLKFYKMNREMRQVSTINNDSPIYSFENSPSPKDQDLKKGVLGYSSTKYDGRVIRIGG